jgi:hypothetical protein
MLELGLSGYRRGRVGEKGLGLSQLGLSFARGGRARASRVRSSECKWGRARRFQRTSLARGLRGLGARCRCYAARPARAPACACAHGLAARPVHTYWPLTGCARLITEGDRSDRSEGAWLPLKAHRKRTPPRAGYHRGL